jgi:hypothetical protein
MAEVFKKICVFMEQKGSSLFHKIPLEPDESNLYPTPFSEERRKAVSGAPLNTLKTWGVEV